MFNAFLSIVAALIIFADLTGLPAQLASPASSGPPVYVRNVSDAAQRPSFISAPSAAQDAPQTAQGVIMPPSSGDAGLAALLPAYAAQGGPFACGPELAGGRFDFSDPARACGLQEDSAYDVWAYFNVRPWESAQRFASWHDADPTNALSTAEIERWIVIHIAQDYAAQHFPAFAQSEVQAGLDGLVSWGRGIDPVTEWIDMYARYLRP